MPPRGVGNWRHQHSEQHHTAGQCRRNGGRGGIRTHGALAGTPVFKTGALNHSATLPAQEFQSLSVGLARTQCECGPDLLPVSQFRKEFQRATDRPGHNTSVALQCSDLVNGTGGGGPQRNRDAGRNAFAAVRRPNRDTGARNRSGRLSSRMPQPEGWSTAARSWPSSGQEIRWRQCRGCACYTYHSDARPNLLKFSESPVGTT